MKSSLTCWLLGGALAASLTWNLQPPAPSSAAATTSEANGERTCSALRTDCLVLAPEQERALSASCARSCDVAERHEASARTLFRELERALATPGADADELRGLGRRIAAERERALLACIDAVLEVRASLTGDQLRTLVEQCGSDGFAVR